MNVMGLGFQELLLIFLICALLFGSTKLPELGRSIGKSIKEFKTSMREITSDESDKRPDSSKTNLLG